MGDFFTSNLFVEIVTAPKNGMAIVSGSTVVEYTADDAYVGLDSIQFNIECAMKHFLISVIQHGLGTK